MTVTETPSGGARRAPLTATGMPGASRIRWGRGVAGDFSFNLSNFYMALLMVFPMGIIMIAVAFVATFFAGRAELFVGDREFLASMIPHHSRAILVCEQSDISDPEIETLCHQIIESQQSEIDQMKRIMERLDR